MLVPALTPFSSVDLALTARGPLWGGWKRLTVAAGWRADGREPGTIAAAGRASRGAEPARDDRGVRQEDREAEDERGADVDDPAASLTAEGIDDAVAESLRDRLDAIDRALRRLDEGTYGRSVRSGVPIPDERLEADPAAELTVEEARG